MKVLKNPYFIGGVALVALAVLIEENQTGFKDLLAAATIGGAICVSIYYFRQTA